MRVLTKRPLYTAHVGLVREVSFQGLVLEIDGEEGLTGKRILLWKRDHYNMIKRLRYYSLVNTVARSCKTSNGLNI